MGYIKQQYEIINERIGVLTALLQRLPVSQALVAPLPKTPRGLEDEPIMEIPVNPLSERAAVLAAIECYRDFHIHPTWSQKVARRTVGAIWFRPAEIKKNDTNSLRSNIDAINNAKSAIETHITSQYSTRSERFEALRAECPAVMTMHLYRQVRLFLDQSVRTVQFSWSRKDTLLPGNKAELISRVEQELENASPEYAVPLEQLRERLASAPPDALRTRRPARVQPVANLRLDSRHTKTVTAPMPLLFVQNEPIKINPIRPFDGKKQRQSRSDRSSFQILGYFQGVTVEQVER